MLVCFRRNYHAGHAQYEFAKGGCRTSDKWEVIIFSLAAKFKLIFGSTDSQICGIRKH